MYSLPDIKATPTQAADPAAGRSLVISRPNASASVEIDLDGQRIERPRPAPPPPGALFAFCPAFGAQVAVDRLEASVQTAAVPDGYIVLNSGSFLSQLVWPQRSDPGSFNARLAPGADLALNFPVSFQAYTPNVLLEVTLPSGVGAGGISAGLYLRTDDGALLRLQHTGPAIRFSTAAGDKETGAREMPAPPGACTLRLHRNGDAFRAEAGGSGGLVEIGALTWPGLKPQAQAGFNVGRDFHGQPGPADAVLPVRGFKLEAAGPRIQP
jgi:hypothetical protein